MRNPLTLRTGRLACIFLAGLAALLLQALPVAGAGQDEIQFQVDRFILEGKLPIAEKAAQRVLKPYTGHALLFSDLQAAASSLEAALQDEGFVFYRISVPPQRIVDGQVRLRVDSHAFKAVRVEDNQRFDTPNILGSLPPLRVGQSPNTLEVARSLQFANEHPAKRVAVFVKQAPEGDGIDARVAVQETRPYQVFANVNNTGTNNPGRTRAAVGVQHSNLFNRDHILTATYTTSPDSFSEVNQYGVDYRLPIYAIATELEAYYSYSQVDQGIIGDFFDVSGRGQFFGFNATRTLLPVGVYNHKWAIRYQDRFFDNETRFLGTLLTDDVRSTPLGFRYSFGYEPKHLTIGGYAGWEFNAGLGSHNEAQHYRANREGAERQWHKFTGGGHLRWALPGDVQIRGRFNAQYSDQSLIPGEQFGIGGDGSVRGYEGREIAGDDGIQASLEVWSPPQILGVRGVVFADAGRVHRHGPSSGTDDPEGISGLGIGLRWNWKGYVDVGCDLAYALEDAVTTQAGDVRFLYQVSARY